MNEELWYGDRRYSKITTRFPDRAIFPDFYKAKRMEFIIRPGEMLFIPAGWFHFVFSEDVDPETGLCAAINFWYEKDRNIKYIEDNTRRPKFGWHNLNYDKIISFIKTKKIPVVKSPYPFFPPTQFKFRFPECSQEHMTFDEFCKSKNPDYYVAQVKLKEYDQFAIPFERPVNKSSVWINWGNHITLPHYDGDDNWLCQLKGTKRVTLVHPSERDKMYLFNPYPLGFVNHMHEKLNNDEKLIHVHRSTFQNADGYTGNTIECSALSHMFMCEIQHHNVLLRKNGSKPLPGNMTCKTFKIEKFKKGDEIPSYCPLGIIWALEKCTIQVRKTEITLEPGNLVSFPGNWLYPSRAKSKVTCILPFKD